MDDSEDYFTNKNPSRFSVDLFHNFINNHKLRHNHQIDN